jgi:hypothetical protein
MVRRRPAASSRRRRRRRRSQRRRRRHHRRSAGYCNTVVDGKTDRREQEQINNDKQSRHKTTSDELRTRTYARGDSGARADSIVMRSLALTQRPRTNVNGKNERNAKPDGAVQIARFELKTKTSMHRRELPNGGRRGARARHVGLRRRSLSAQLRIDEL